MRGNAVSAVVLELRFSVLCTLYFLYFVHFEKVSDFLRKKLGRRS